MHQLASLRASRDAGEAHAPIWRPLAASPFLRWEGLALISVFACLLLGLSHPLQDLNEGLYARIPQEMLQSGHWIVPTLNGVPYLEKPPLMYWLTAAAYAMFGANEWTARSAPVVGAALLLAAVYWFARRHLRGNTPLLATVMLASTPLMMVLGRTVLFDSLFTALLTWSLVMLYEYWREPRKRRWLRWSYACLALAVLTKGFAAIIVFALIALAFAFATSGGAGATLRRIRSLFDPVALVVFFALVMPWHVLAALEQPGFATFYFVNEHLLRFIGRRLPADYHTGPWWYYLPRIVAHVFPWSLLLLIPAKRPPAGSGMDPGIRRFLWIWLLAPVILFSLSQAKGDYYMLLVAPPLMLLLAQRLRAMIGKRLLSVVPLAWLVVLGIVPIRLFLSYRAPEHAGAFLAAAAALACIAAAAFAYRKHVVAVLTTAAIALPVMLIYSGFFVANEDAKSTRALAQFIRASGVSEVYLYRDFETLSSLPFYLDEPVGVVASASRDLAYGMLLKPDPQRFPTASEFAAAAARRPIWLVVERKRWKEFEHTRFVTQFTLQREAPHHLLLISTRGLLALGERNTPPDED